MTTRATVSQAKLIRKLMASHVVTDKERAGIAHRLAHGFDRGTPSEAIEWLLSEVKARKQAEKEAAERQQAALPL